MDSTALNYNSLANVELTGSCIAVVQGCMNPLAFNYNPNANVSDTCIAVLEGCTNPIALNYDSLANTDDSSCVLPIPGCTDSDAFNFNPLANVNDSSCIENTDLVDRQWPEGGYSKSITPSTLSSLLYQKKEIMAFY